MVSLSHIPCLMIGNKIYHKPIQLVILSWELTMQHLMLKYFHVDLLSTKILSISNSSVCNVMQTWCHSLCILMLFILKLPHPWLLLYLHIKMCNVLPDFPDFCTISILMLSDFFRSQRARQMIGYQMGSPASNNLRRWTKMNTPKYWNLRKNCNIYPKS